jgi:hypothetical protein
VASDSQPDSYVLSVNYFLDLYGCGASYPAAVYGTLFSYAPALFIATFIMAHNQLLA